MTLQEKMIRYRATERISQREMARRCGVSLQTINSVEGGTQKPSRLTEQKIRLVIERGEADEIKHKQDKTV